MEDAIAQFAAGVVALLAAIITYVVVPWIRAKTTAEQRATAYGIVTAGVGMAEQIGQTLGLDGEAKKKRARDWIIGRFKEVGISVDHDELEGWIEDAVLHVHDHIVQLTMEDRGQKEDPS